MTSDDALPSSGNYVTALPTSASASSTERRANSSKGEFLRRQTQPSPDPLAPFGNASNCVQYPTLRPKASGSFGLMPRTEARPQLGRTRPVIRLRRVVLPEPLGPTRLVTPGGVKASRG